MWPDEAAALTARDIRECDAVTVGPASAAQRCRRYGDPLAPHGPDEARDVTRPTVGDAARGGATRSASLAFPPRAQQMALRAPRFPWTPYTHSIPMHESDGALSTASAI